MARLSSGANVAQQDVSVTRQEYAELKSSKDLESYRSSFLESSRQKEITLLSQEKVPESLSLSVKNRASEIIDRAQAMPLEQFSDYCERSLKLVDPRAVRHIHNLAQNATSSSGSYGPDHAKAIEFTALLINPGREDLPVWGASKGLTENRQINKLFAQYGIEQGNYSELRNAIKNDSKYESKKSSATQKRLLAKVGEAEADSEGKATLSSSEISRQEERVTLALNLSESGLSFEQKLMNSLVHKNKNGAAVILKKWGNREAYEAHIDRDKEYSKHLAEINRESEERQQKQAFQDSAEYLAVRMEKDPKRVQPSARKFYNDAVTGDATGLYAEAVREAHSQRTDALPIDARVGVRTLEFNIESGQSLLKNILSGNETLQGNSRFSTISDLELSNLLGYVGSLSDTDGRAQELAISRLPADGQYSVAHENRVAGLFRLIEKTATESVLAGNRLAFSNLEVFLKDPQVSIALQRTVGISPGEVDKLLARGIQIVPGIPKEIETHKLVIDSRIEHFQRMKNVGILKVDKMHTSEIQNRIDALKRYSGEKFPDQTDSPDAKALQDFINSSEKRLNAIQQDKRQRNIPAAAVNSIEQTRSVAYDTFRQYLELDKQNLSPELKQQAIRSLTSEVVRQLGVEGMREVSAFAKKNWYQHTIDKDGNQNLTRKKKLDDFIALAG